MNRRQFEIKLILDSLRSEIGDSEFGYRMQSFFAHTLVGLGATIKEINAQGHPDVKADLHGRRFNFQVKTALHSGPGFEFVLTVEDLNGIRSTTSRSGFLAMLDCAEPVKWLVVSEGNLEGLAGRPVHMATLQAIADPIFSAECTEEFVEIIIGCSDRISNLTFAILKKRAIEAGRP